MKEKTEKLLRTKTIVKRKLQLQLKKVMEVKIAAARKGKIHSAALS